MVKRRKGQLLVTDFIISIAVFLAIMLAAMSLWNSVDTQIRDTEQRRDMQEITVYVSDTLVRSTGHPSNWTNETAQVIGLASDEHVLDVDKVLRLKHMDYDKARSTMRLGNYDFYMWLTDGAGYNLTSGIVRSPAAVIVHDKRGLDYARMLDKSMIVWDVYSDDAGDVDTPFISGFTKRNSYRYATPVESLNRLMLNQTSYRTIIIEDIGVQPSDLTADEKNVFLNFTRNGGILIYTDAAALPNQPLVNLLGMSFEAYNGNSWVSSGKPVFLNSSNGDVVTFSNAVRRAYSNPVTNDETLHVISNSTPDRCEVCWWDYGFGRVYYLEDTSGTIRNSTGQTDQLANHLNIVGESLTAGIKGEQMSDRINVRRMAVLSGFEREVANLNIVVWRYVSNE